MATVVDITQYTLLPFSTYNALPDKLNGLMNGDVILLKNFERNEGAHVLVQLVSKKFMVTQMSYDMTESVTDPRYWVTFNLGINDLSLHTAFKFEEGLFLNTNKYMINDVVSYTNQDGAVDSAVITAVYVSNSDPNQFAYQLSRDPEGLYAEEDLIQNKYQ